VCGDVHTIAWMESGELWRVDVSLSESCDVLQHEIATDDFQPIARMVFEGANGWSGRQERRLCMAFIINTSVYTLQDP